jgi:PEP-CTERM motif-containing protein
MRTTALRSLLASALLFGVVVNAQAIPMLRLTTSAGGNVTVADGDANDQLAADGVVLFTGSLPGWAVNITSGLSKPAVGSAEAPLLDLASVNLSSSFGTSGSIDIWLTDTDFTAIPTQASVLSAIGGTTSGTISYQTFFDPSNTPFGTANLLTSVGPFGSAAFSSTADATLSSTDPFSLTLLVSITHDGSSPYQLTSFDATVKVPEPSTLPLFGIGSLALALAARRRIRPSASATR